jgi:hypothetical protein
VVATVGCQTNLIVDSVMTKSSMADAVVPSGLVTTRVIVPVPLQFTV